MTLGRKPQAFLRSAPGSYLSILSTWQGEEEAAVPDDSDLVSESSTQHQLS